MTSLFRSRPSRNTASAVADSRVGLLIWLLLPATDIAAYSALGFLLVFMGIMD